MRTYFVLIFALISICCAQREQEKYNVNGRAGFADISRICINCLRKLLKNGASLPILTVPPLDPLHINKYPIMLDSDSFRGVINVQDVTLQGFSDFEVNAINETLKCIDSQTTTEDPTEVTTSVDVTGNDKEWKSQRMAESFYSTISVNLGLETDYDAEMMLMGFVPVFGKGHADADLKLYLTTGMTDEGTKGGVKITDFTACLDVNEDMKLGITGLQGDAYMSGLITNQLKAILVEGINDHYKEGLSNELNVIKRLINTAFGNGLLNVFVLTLLDEICGKDESITTTEPATTETT